MEKIYYTKEKKKKKISISLVTRMELYIILKSPIKCRNVEVILIELFRGSSLSLAEILLCLNIDRKDYRNSTRSAIDWIFQEKKLATRYRVPKEKWPINAQIFYTLPRTEKKKSRIDPFEQRSTEP